MNKVIGDIRRQLRAEANPEKAAFFPHFFKLEPGETDEFLGVTVPKQRQIVKAHFKQITSKEVQELLHSPIHEERLSALLIWVAQFKHGDETARADIYGLYLKNTEWVNNWDLVDSSARDIVGAFLFDKDRGVLHKLADSENIWERRIAIIATFYFIQKGEFHDTLWLAEQYLDDQHHYIHKATGWMLREIGKKDDEVLRHFLDLHVKEMPRTMLRYAIERLDEPSRRAYMARH